MSLSNETKTLQIQVAKLRPGKGRKYPLSVRRRILAWVDRAKETGMLEADCSRVMDVPQHRFASWRDADRRAATKAAMAARLEPAIDESLGAASMAMVPIAVSPSIQVTLGLAFVTPRGFRIEGLSLEQAFALIREYA